MDDTKGASIAHHIWQSGIVYILYMINLASKVVLHES